MSDRMTSSGVSVLSPRRWIADSVLDGSNGDVLEGPALPILPAAVGIGEGETLELAAVGMEWR